MAQYVITIIGHLKQQDKPPELPDVVSDFAIVTVKDKDELMLQVRQHMIAPIKMQAMIVRKDVTTFDPKALDVDYLTIPLNMFSLLESKVSQLIGEEPLVNADGELFNPSGAPVVKH